MQAPNLNEESGTPAAPQMAGAPDFNTLKQRQQLTWASGDYAVIGTTLQIVGEQLAESLDLRAGSRVLDVAAGNGNATLAAARRFTQVTSTDYVPGLLEKGRLRAQAEGLAVTFEVADAENLPYADASFDVALSVFGSMFTPDQQRTASEMLRVVKPGGRIGLASWTPDGFIGQLFKVIAGFVPPPANLKSPLLWGTEPHIVELFGSSADDIQAARRMFNFRYRSEQHWIEAFRNYYGPVLKAFASLDSNAQIALETELTKLLQRFNVGGAHSLVVPGAYLEVVVTKHQ
jgi:ubiquinone/menaquinone biosynthesis C-methylase UbiE